ncbi:MAG: nucleotidyltransferase family protein [Shimia sp.]
MPYPCMIFAAGFGTRMRPMTDDRPKPLIKVAGRTLLSHALEPARAVGAAPIVVNAHYKAPMIARAVAGRDIHVQHEDPILDTGGGLKAALPRLGEGPVFTMNSDAVWDGPNPYTCLASARDDAKARALLLCVPVARALGRTDQGDFMMAPDGRLSRGPGVVYTGAQLIDGALVQARPETVFSLNTVWDAAIADGTLAGVLYPGRWCDVGRPESIPLAEAMVGHVHAG